MRKLAAIINGDVVGYSRLMAHDEETTIVSLGEMRELIRSLVTKHNGMLMDFTGDNFLAEFPSTVDSMECALKIQETVEARNVNVSKGSEMRFRIGAHVGDIRVESGRIYGSGVNVAARLEALAAPGGVCISRQMLDLVSEKLDLHVQDCGPQNVKNIPKPVHAFLISPPNGVSRTKEPTEHAAIRSHLIEILSSGVFEKSPRQQRFLKHVVDNALNGDESNLKGYAIGVEVFDRADDFDPAVDSIVRVEATRLRAKLREYYDTVEPAGPIKIELPKGSYSPRFKSNSSALPASTALSVAEGLHSANQKPRLIVLPFLNISDDSDQEYFVDGVTEDLIMGLSKLSNLHVLARHSTFFYKGKQIKTTDIAREIDVQYVVEGSVRKVANKVRISTELILAESEEPVWRERYDRDLDDIFAVQDDVVKKIVGALDLKLSDRDKARVFTDSVVNPEAHDFVSRGRECFWRFTPNDVAQARKLYERAIEIDPNYALAHAWIARTIVLPISFNWSTDMTTLDAAIYHARRALELEPTLPYAHGISSWTHLWRRDLQNALVEGQLAVDLDPNDFDSHMFYSMVLSAGGKGAEAIKHAEQCLELNPHQPATAIFALGFAHLISKHLDIAIEVLQSGSAKYPAFAPYYIFLAQAYVELGKREECITTLKRLKENSGASMDDPKAWSIIVDDTENQRFKKARNLALTWYRDSTGILK